MRLNESVDEEPIREGYAYVESGSERSIFSYRCLYDLFTHYNQINLIFFYVSSNSMSFLSISKRRLWVCMSFSRLLNLSLSMSSTVKYDAIQSCLILGSLIFYTCRVKNYTFYKYYSTSSSSIPYFSLFSSILSILYFFVGLSPSFTIHRDPYFLLTFVFF